MTFPTNEKVGVSITAQGLSEADQVPIDEAKSLVRAGVGHQKLWEALLAIIDRLTGEKC